MTAPEPASARIAFVTGGSGFVGGRLIERLVRDGWLVRALARSASTAVAVRTLGAEPVVGDLDGEAAMKAGMDGAEIVFHVAAHFKLWGPRKLFWRVNVDGMRHVVNAAAATTSVRRVVGVSAAAVVMGDPKPMVGVDETAARRRRRFAPYSASKAEGERILLKANGKRSEFETVAIRPPFIWGKGMPTLDDMAETVEAGRFRWVGGGSQAMSTAHVDNLVEALVLAADRGAPGKPYFVSDGRDGTLKSVISALLATRGVKPKDRTAPFPVAWAMAGVMGFVWRAFRLKGEPPLTRQMLRLIGKDFTINIAKARRELGYAPVVTWEEGLDEMRGDGETDRDQSRLLAAATE